MKKHVSVWRSLMAGLSLLTAAASLASLPACSTGSKTGSDMSAKELAQLRPGALTREMASTRAKQISRVNYTMWFGIAPKTEDFEGRVVINFDLREKAKDASDDLFVDFEGGKLRSLNINQKAVLLEVPSEDGKGEPDSSEYKRRYDGHRIAFKVSELNPGSNRIEIAFTHPYGNSGRGLHRFQDPADGNTYLYTHFEPYNAHDMFPCFDQPDLKASYEVTVEAPDGWEVISNTREREVTNVDGRKSWAFAPTPLLSTYLFALHAGPYSSWSADAEGIPMRLFARKSLEKYIDPQEWFEVTRQGLDYFAVYFGYPYPYSKYDQIIVPDFNAGAMENAGAITFTERFVFRGKVTEEDRMNRADVILHEMAHQWFGDLVTMRWWNGLWLNESFATYMAAKALDESTRFKKSWQSFFSGSKQWAYWEDQLVTTHPIETSVPSTDHAFTNFDGITYGKGASTLKQLNFYLGEDDFREGLQRYFQRFALRNTTLADFMRMLSEASGRHLADWQRAWLQTSGVNTVEAVYVCKTDPATQRSVISSFNLKQTPQEGTEQLRPHKTRVALYYPAGKLPKKKAPAKGDKKKPAPALSGGLQPAEVLEVDYTRAENPVTAAIGLDCPTLVFPNHQDFDYVKVSLDQQSLEAARKSLSEIADPLARQMIWHTLYEMVVDGKLASQDYIDIVLVQADKEKDSEVRNQVMRTLAGSASVRYLAPALTKPYLGKIEAFKRKHLNAAPAGGDAQLDWFQFYLNSAHTPGAIDFLRALLDGKKSLAGLKMDQDRRWEIIRTLARNNARDVQTLIAAELKRDATDMGRKEAISAEAMIPTVEMKKKWLARILRQSGDESGKPYKLAELRQAAGSFYQPGQEALTQMALEPYFEELPKLAQSENEEYIRTISRQMYPRLCDARAIERTGALLGKKSLPASAVKNLRIQRQQEERCIRARSLSADRATSQ